MLDESRIVWDEYGHGRCEAFVPAFGQEVPFVFFAEVSAKLRAAFDDVISLPGEARDQVTDMLWDDCQFTFAVADFGYVAGDGETHLEAHLRGFGVRDAHSAYENSTIKEVHIDDDGYPSRYAIILVETVAGDLINVIVKDGRIIDYDEDGTHPGWFEKDEQHAHRGRQELLSKYQS